ncbi:hypothetical protein BKA70DRAFT_1431226 [Coprinopsis sp. MPI-PUGE-AT-0042]|nr:hypothetical protein BKA70DRAFT_1431226 [Coprinopsis sp. MPI-PUGE-AT-0042]
MSVNEAFPIDAAQIVGVFMEAVFYGANGDPRIYLVTFVNCLKTLLWIDGGFKPLHQLHHKMLVAALLMFVFGSLDVAFHLRHNLDAFVGAPNPQAVLDHFNDTSNWINVMKMAAYVMQTFVGDAILLYRCWIIYNRGWMVVALPALLWLGCTACGAMTIYVEATLDTDGALLNAKNLIPFITSMLSLTLAMNLLTTGLIVHRIWRVQRRLKRRSTYTNIDSPLSRVLVVMIESGLMYTASIVILFGLYMAGHNGQYGVSNSVVQIIGITFNLIITSVDRASQHNSASASASGAAGSNRVALHQIHVSTVTARYPDFNVEEGKDSRLDTSPVAKSDWR